MDIPDNETRKRILDAAETLFSERGFAAVRLRDIAEVVGMRHASLYYYAPGGKEQLYVEVMQRSFQRHYEGLTQAIAAAGEDFRDQIHAVVRWLASQPPLDMTRMLQADMPAISKEQSRVLMAQAYDALRNPIAGALERAAAAGMVNVEDVNLAAMGLVSLVQSVHSIPFVYGVDARVGMGTALADMLLVGWLKR
jgi:AcrR family transcriptional regulator